MNLRDRRALLIRSRKEFRKKRVAKMLSEQACQLVRDRASLRRQLDATRHELDAALPVYVAMRRAEDRCPGQIHQISLHWNMGAVTRTLLRQTTPSRGLVSQDLSFAISHMADQVAGKFERSVAQQIEKELKECRIA